MTYKKRPAGAGGALLVSRKLHNLIDGYDAHLREFDDVNYFMRAWDYPVSFAYAKRAVAITSNRRHKEQGRLALILQGMSDQHFLVRHFVRPLMKKLGIQPKGRELD